MNSPQEQKESLPELQAVRERLVTIMIYLFAVVSLPSVVLGVAKQVTQGYWRFIPFYLVMYAIAVLAAIMNKQIPYKIKAVGTLILLYVFATGILAKYGLSGAGVWVFTTLCVLATMLFGIRFALASAVAAILSIAVVGFMMTKGTLPFDPDVLMNSVSGLSWMLAGTWFFVVAMVVVFSPGVLLASLEKSFHLLNRNSEEIRTTNERLRREIADRERKERELKKSEERYRLLAENAKDVIWTMSMDLKYTFISPSVMELSGRTVEEILKQPMKEHMTTESFSKAMDIMAKIKNMAEEGELSSYRSWTLELEQYKRDGTTYWTEVNVSPLVDGNGIVTGVIGVTRDISERLDAEKALRESEEKYRTLIEQTDLGIFIFQDDRVIFANEGFRKIIGAGKNPLDQINPFELLDEPSRAIIIETYQLWLNGDESDSQFNLTLRALDGETRSVVLRTQQIKYKGRQAIHGVVSDVTQQLSLEAQLQQSQKMEAIGRLAGGVAHDFNNLLTGIQGYAQILLQSDGLSDDQNSDLKQIQKAARTAGHVTEQLLAFSRKQIVSPEVVNLNGLIRRSQKMLGRLIGEDIELRYEPGENAGNVKIDAHQIDQVLVNLAVNARDAMPEGGTLLIETFTAELDEEACRVHSNLEPGSYAVLSVEDTGCGIDSETQKLIFEPFFTTKEEGKGTGLGLATVYGIVNQNRGMITVHSKAGQGATFNIYLPQVAEPAESLTPQPELAQRMGSETILLVEDEKMLRTLSQRILLMHGYHVLVADCGQNALEVYQNADRNIDMLLTDVIMPRMNGKELYEEIAATQPDIKILYMSGHSEDVIARHGVLEEGTNFLPKPFTVEELSRKVREVLDQ